MARKFYPCEGQALNFPCPECGRFRPKGFIRQYWTIKGWRRGAQTNTIIGFYVDENHESVVALRIHCLSCEHSWTYELEV